MKAPAFWWNAPGTAAAFLSPLAAIYGAVAARRLSRPGARAGIPVICVGNPTVGGAGKTPAAIAVAQLLLAAGENPAFLTRGYGGSRAGPVVVQTTHSATEVGDEPLLLKRVAPTVVARDRVAGARLAHENGASILVMDDGFQNPSLEKDLSILVIDARRGLGNGRVIPAGPLRAPIEPQIARAHAILMVGESSSSVQSDGRPVFHGKLIPDPGAVAALQAQRVLAFAGIGDPEKFFATIVAAGIDAPVRRSFPDHHAFRADEAGALIAEADREKLTLLTTEKDRARMQGDAALAQLAARARVLPVTLAVSEAEDFRNLVLGVRRV